MTRSLSTQAEAITALMAAILLPPQDEPLAHPPPARQITVINCL